MKTGEGNSEQTKSWIYRFPCLHGPTVFLLWTILFPCPHVPAEFFWYNMTFLFKDNLHVQKWPLPKKMIYLYNNIQLFINIIIWCVYKKKYIYTKLRTFSSRVYTFLKGLTVLLIRFVVRVHKFPLLVFYFQYDIFVSYF